MAEVKKIQTRKLGNVFGDPRQDFLGGGVFKIEVNGEVNMAKVVRKEDGAGKMRFMFYVDGENVGNASTMLGTRSMLPWQVWELGGEGAVWVLESFEIFEKYQRKGRVSFFLERVVQEITTRPGAYVYVVDFSSFGLGGKLLGGAAAGTFDVTVLVGQTMSYVLGQAAGQRGTVRYFRINVDEAYRWLAAAESHFYIDKKILEQYSNVDAVVGYFKEHGDQIPAFKKIVKESEGWLRNLSSGAFLKLNGLFGPGGLYGKLARAESDFWPADRPYPQDKKWDMQYLMSLPHVPPVGPKRPLDAPVSRYDRDGFPDLRWDGRSSPS